MISLKLSKDEKDEEMGIPGGSDYPYGLRIDLDDETLGKLGMLDDLPDVGEVILINAKATVVSVSQNATGESDDPSDKEQRVSLQITDMEASDEAPDQDTAKMLYGVNKG